MILHWGNEGEGGSEHSVNGHFFPAEIQVGYLYKLKMFFNAERLSLKKIIPLQKEMFLQKTL